MPKIPSFVRIDTSTIPNAGLGVFANKTIKKGVCLGEYKGKFLTPSEYEKKKNYKSYVWEILAENGEISGYVDGGNKKYSNWTRYVNSPSVQKKENVEMKIIHGRVFYFSCKNIKKGNELFIWYGEEYAKFLGLLKQN